MTPAPLTAQTQGECQWNTSASGLPIYLIGDSVADHYSEGVIAAGISLGRPVTVTTAASCPMYHIVVKAVGDAQPVDHTDPTLCVPFVDGTLNWLDEQPAGTVIIGGTDVLWWNPSPVVPAKYGIGAPADERTSAVVAGMSATVERLQAAGHEVVLAKAPPSYRFPEPGWDKADCSTIEVAQGACFTSEALASIDELQQPAREILDTVANDTGASILDFRAFFCSDEECTTQRGSTSLYLDDIHISVTASKELAPRFEAFLGAN